MNSALDDKIKYIESLAKHNFDIKKRELHFYEALLFFKIDLSKTKKIIVTGTNGKGSVCHYLSSFLVSQSKKVGSFTSPYYISFNERIKINNCNITDEELEIILDEVINYETVKNHPFSFFEIITICSLICFSRHQVDYLIMEVGIGGLYDCTNFLNYDIAIITSIGLDHEAILGKTKKQIFLNKLGIFQPFTTLITFNDLFKKFSQKRACLISGKLSLINKRKVIHLSESKQMYYKDYYPLVINSKVQAYNLSLAINSFTNLGFSLSTIKQVINNVSLPGRTELIDNFLLDGAHNEEAINNLIKFLKTNFKNYKIKIFYSVLKDKNLKKITSSLLFLTKDITFVTFDDVRGYLKTELVLPEKVGVISFPEINFQNLKELNNTICVFTGSIHFIAKIRIFLVKN